MSGTLPIVQLPMEPNASRIIMKALETKDVTFEELTAASNLVTAAMGRLMDIRERINDRMRATGRLR